MSTPKSLAHSPLTDQNPISLSFTPSSRLVNTPKSRESPNIRRPNHLYTAISRRSRNDGSRSSTYTNRRRRSLLSPASIDSVLVLNTVWSLRPTARKSVFIPHRQHPRDELPNLCPLKTAGSWDTLRSFNAETSIPFNITSPTPT